MFNSYVKLPEGIPSNPPFTSEILIEHAPRVPWASPASALRLRDRTSATSFFQALDTYGNLNLPWEKHEGKKTGFLRVSLVSHLEPIQ